MFKRIGRFFIFSSIFIALVCFLPSVVSAANSTTTRTQTSTTTTTTDSNTTFDFSNISMDYVERIVSYDSKILVQSDGELKVTETISVNAQGFEIKHGIFRDFPTVYHDKFGFVQAVPFDITNAAMDGAPVDYWTESVDGGVRIYLGFKDEYLEDGKHTFSLSYTTSRQLGSYDDHDELFYNITGNGWAFDIDKVTATVILPFDGIGEKVKADGYTGIAGSKNKDFTAQVASDGKTTTVTYQSIDQLSSGEGLTVFISWPKNLISFISAGQYSVTEFMFSNWLFFVGIIVVTFLIGYYFLIWMLKGRDPKKKAVYPRYEISEKLTTGMVRYINNFNVDMKAITSAIVSIAVKGYWKIKMEKKWFKKEYSLEKTGGDISVLSDDERVIAAAIMGDIVSGFTFEQGNYAQIQTMNKLYKDYITKQKGAGLVSSNILYFIIGFAVVIAYAILCFASVGYAINTSNDASFAGIVSIIASSVGLVGLLKIVFKVEQKSNTGFILKVLGIVGFLGLICLGVVTGISGMQAVPLYLLVFWPLIFVVLWAANFALKVRSQEGTDYYTEIQGFKMFLTATEEQKIKMFGKEFPKTIETFEKFLPYAIALDIEPLWSKQFEDVLNSNSVNTQERYWYSSSYMGFSNMAFATSFGSSMASTISSNAVAPGSSGGGGFGGSGGGGGGGGGGGW